MFIICPIIDNQKELTTVKKRPVLCKPVPGGMTEQEKAEAGLLYNPNQTTEMADYRFKIQDAIHEYNQFRPSQVQGDGSVSKRR